MFVFGGGRAGAGSVGGPGGGAAKTGAASARARVVPRIGSFMLVLVGGRLYGTCPAVERQGQFAGEFVGAGYCSKAKIFFQSFFMLMTVQPCFFAMSYISWLKVPTLVSGKPCAGP